MQHSLFSISYAGLWGQAVLAVRPFIRRAAELGYTSVLLAGKRPQLSVLDSDDEQIQLLIDHLRSSGVTCSVIGAYVDLGMSGAAEVPLLEMQIAYVESLCRIGKRLGSRFVRVFTAYESASLPFQVVWQRTVTAIQEMSDRAAAYGITIAI